MKHHIDSDAASSSLESVVEFLPMEIYSKIFEDLDYQSLLTCMQVNSLFRDLIIGTASLQYIIELAVSGQRDGSCNPFASADSLEILRAHQVSWNKLKWGREMKIPMRNGGLWELYGGVFAQSTPEGTIVFNQLPSDLRCIQEKEWTLGPDFGMTVRDFGMDTSQDLLVLIESPDWSLPDTSRKYRIHLRSLSTGKAHPLALKEPVLSLPQTGIDHNVSYTIQITGSYLGILFGLTISGENEVAIWDWKTGLLFIDITSEDILSFSLLSDPWVLLSVIDHDGSPSLLAVNFRKESSSRHSLLHVTNSLTFQYPELHERAYISDIDIRCDPGPLSQPNSLAPFSQDTKQFLFVISIWLFIDDVLKCLIHFVPSSHFKCLLDSADDVTHTFYWSDWIPDNTRLLFPRQYPSDIWVCYVYGMKFAISELSDGKTGYSARLFNFNRLALKKDASSIATLEAPVEIDRSTTLLRGGEAFWEDVSSSLPFWSQTITLEDSHEHCTVLCSEDHIIIVDRIPRSGVLAVRSITLANKSNRSATDKNVREFWTNGRFFAVVDKSINVIYRIYRIIMK